MLEILVALPEWARIALAGVFGLLVGSFLNVIILRLPVRMEWAWRREARELLELEAEAQAAPPGIVFEPSHCPHCQRRLAAWENIPLVSYLLLRGRCRSCKAPISKQYPLVEALTALAFIAAFWRFGLTPATLAAFAFSAALIVLAVIDLRTMYLPDSITLPLLWLGLLLGVWGVFVGADAAIVGAAAGYLSLWSVYWLFKLTTGKEGMGYGDFKLLAAIGAWGGAKAILPTILLSSVVGAIIGSAILLAQGRDRATPIPFGPYLAIAGWIQFIWADELGAFWMRLTGLPLV